MTAPQGPSLIYDDRGERVVFPIPEGEMFVGRKDDCDLCFPDGSVSKRHVRIVRQGARVELYDAGSRNGTLVNEQSVDRHALAPGDLIQLGKISLTFTDGSGPGAGAAAGPAAKPWKPARTNDSFRDFGDFDDQSSRGGKSRTPSTGRQERASRKSLDAPPGTSNAGPDEETQRASVDAPAERARFTIVDGLDKGRTFEVGSGSPVTIGTKEGNAVQLTGDGISRYHAEVILENGAWVLKDLGSKNGVFVGGRKVDLHELVPGDEVQIGTVRLRFDRLSGGASPSDPAALVKLLKEDPKGFLRTPFGRRAVFGLVASLLLVVIFAGNNAVGPGPSRPTATRNAFHDAFDLVRAGKVGPARETISRARQSGTAADDKILRELDTVAKAWEQRRFLLTFDWKAAAGTLEQFRKVAASELRPDEASWVDGELQTVQHEQTNSQYVDQGSRAFTSAADAAHRKDLQAEIDALKAGIAAYRLVPRESALYESAQQQVTRHRPRLLDAYQKEAERRVDSDKPDWTGAIAVLTEASKYTESVAERAILQNKIDDYDTNQKDAQSTDVVVDIVSKRQVDRYDEGLQILSQIHKTSRCYPDAQIYAHWIQADRDVRNAKVSYDAGDWDRARTLLLGALTYSKDFGPDAKASVTRRLEAWTRVYTAYTQGCESADKNDVKKATALFQSVLSLEPNPKNRFHFLAQARLDIIAATANQAIQDALKDGFAYLNQGRWRDATDKFAYVVITTKNDPQYRGQIEEAVAQVNAREKLYQKASQAWMNDTSSEFEGSLESLRLIKHFLPRTDPLRDKAKELYDNIKRRLSTAAEQEKAIEDAKKEDGDSSSDDKPTDTGKPLELPKARQPRNDSPPPPPSTPGNGAGNQ